jgi:hypothetical protein
MEIDEKGLLTDFEWDDDASFFEETPEVVTEDKEEPEEEKPEKKEIEKKEKKEEPEEEEFFTEGFEPDKKEVTEDGKSFSFKGTLTKLKEKSLLNFEEDLDEELTEEDAETLFEETLENEVNSRVEELIDELPDNVKEITRIALKGGDVQAYLNLSLAQGNFSLEDIDIKDEEHQEYVMKNILKKKGHSNEYIENQIEFFKDKGVLEKMAEEEYNKEMSAIEEQKLALKTATDQRIKDNKIKYQEARKSVSAFLKENDSINGIPIDPKIKNVLPDYVLTKKYKMQNGSEISEFQKDIYEALNNEKVVLQLALLLKKRDKDGNFDFTGVKNVARTEVTKEIKEEIQRSKKNLKSASTGSSHRSLADYL